jgi:hypothetical protein
MFIHDGEVPCLVVVVRWHIPVLFVGEVCHMVKVMVSWVSSHALISSVGQKEGEK